jgi:hypothetical protein
MEYIHISDFPKDKIYILLNEEYRKFLIEKSVKILGCNELIRFAHDYN